MDEKHTPKLFSAAGVVHQDDGLKEGFLSAYWSSKKPLPKLRGVAKAVYYLKLGLNTIISIPTSSFITVFTIAVSLFLLAGFILILQNVSSVLSSAGSSLYASCYFSESASEQQVNELVESLRQNSRIRSVDYISKDQALAFFRDDLGDNSGFLEGLGEANPLPRSADLVFRSIETSGFQDANTLIRSFVNNLKDNPVVDEVVFGSQWIERMQEVVSAFRFFGVIGVIVMIAIVVFLISNTIKLVIYSQRDEISIMQLVGASDSFIKIPFLIGGVLQGVIGSLLGLFFLKIGFALLNFEIRNSQVIGVAVTDLSFLPVWLTLIILLLGVAVGAMGSLMSLGRFLNV